MTATVRCVGKFKEPRVFYGDREMTGVNITVTKVPTDPPCGWASRLDGWALMPLTGDSGVTPPVCPECGGRLELVGADP